MPLLVVTLTLTGIIWLTQSLRFVDLIVNKGLDVSTFLYISVLLIPSFLMLILPVALFISVLMVYNKFISDSELIVLKSAGLSRMSLTRPALVLAGGVAIFCYFVSLYLLPVSYREFKDTQAFIRNNYASSLLQEGVFSTPIKGLTVYIDSRGENGLLEGILIHDSRNEGRPITYMAQEGKLVKTDSGPRFDMTNGNRQEIDKEHGNLSVLYFDSYPMDLSVYTDSEGRNWRTAEERFIGDLFFSKDGSAKEKKNLIAEGHYRIVWPLYSFVLTLIALSALMSGQFNRRGQWKRILAASFFAVMSVVLNLVLKSVATKYTFLSILMYLNVIGTMAGCLYILLTHQIINEIPFVTPIYRKLRSFIKKSKIKAA